MKYSSKKCSFDAHVILIFVTRTFIYCPYEAIISWVIYATQKIENAQEANDISNNSNYNSDNNNN